MSICIKDLSWVYISLIALAANLDNLGVGLVYGLRKIRISWSANLLMSGIAFVATWIPAALGDTVNNYISVDRANMAGAVIILAVGLWIAGRALTAFLRRNNRRVQRLSPPLYLQQRVIITEPESFDADGSKNIDCREAIVLGMALAMNAVAGGLDAGLIRLPALAVALATAIGSFLTIALGVYIGKRYAANYLGQQAALAAGILMGLIGIYQLWYK